MCLALGGSLLAGSLRVRSFSGLVGVAVDDGACLIIANAGSMSYDELAHEVVREPIETARCAYCWSSWVRPAGDAVAPVLWGARRP